MGGQACRLKALMDGARLLAATQILQKHLDESFFEEGEAAYKIITHLNDAEDSIDKATAALLNSQGYDGPLPHSLDFKE